MRILILGGTKFLGPAIVRHAMARGHEITLFNRGKTRTELFPNVTKLRGDRNNDLKSLEGGEWDAVVDTSANIPRWVRTASEVLKDSVGQYVYISSISAYAHPDRMGLEETAATALLDDESVEDVTGGTYGGLKALCERTAEAAFPGRSTSIRPGLIVGPEDPTDRFTYWPVRLRRGGEVLAPGTPEDPVQVIDVRDLGAFIVACVEARHYGTFNAAGPVGGMNVGEMLNACRKAAARDATFTWADADFLEEQGVAAWQHLTVWVPPGSPYGGFGGVSIDKAVRHGLTTRSVEETARDTLRWMDGLPPDRRSEIESCRLAGLPAEREAEVLATWHARSE